jgi:hypothetical protein
VDGLYSNGRLLRIVVLLVIFSRHTTLNKKDKTRNMRINVILRGVLATITFAL